MTSLDLSERDDVETPPPRRRASDDSDMLRVRWSLVFQFVSYILGLFVLYNMMTNRMTAMEVRYEERSAAQRGEISSLKSDIAELKADIKILIGRKS